MCVYDKDRFKAASHLSDELFTRTGKDLIVNLVSTAIIGPLSSPLRSTHTQTLSLPLTLANAHTCSSLRIKKVNSRGRAAACSCGWRRKGAVTDPNRRLRF